MIDERTLNRWTELARRDDWHQLFVGSDVRLMLSEINRLRHDCAEFYQVIGCLSEPHDDVFNQPSVVKALDNASAAANGNPRPHSDLLPFILTSANQRDAS